MYKLNPKDRTKFAKFLTDQAIVPTRNEMALFRAVYQACNQGLHYTCDVYDFVVEELKDILNEDILSANNKNMPIENGHFGMDIFYMRKVVDSILFDEACIESLGNLKLEIGDKFKAFNYGGYKYANATVTNINDEKGIVRMKCTGRGIKGEHSYEIPANDWKFKALVTTEPNKRSAGTITRLNGPY